MGVGNFLFAGELKLCLKAGFGVVFTGVAVA
jgi:hypothetical protein